MATRKTIEKKPKQITLFFETKEQCQLACSSLGLSLRKVADIDCTHAGAYSKMTGHYGTRMKNGNLYRVPLRSKLMIDEDIFDGLDEQGRSSLGYLDVTSVGWIAP